MVEPKLGRSQNRIGGFSSPEIEYQQLRALGAAQYGGASVGEVMFATNGLDETDPAAWVSRFADLGHRTRQLGDAALGRGHRVSARDHFCRASTYFRSAEYYADPLAEQRSIGRQSRDAFCRAVALLSHPAEALEIPYEGSWLPGYFLAPVAGGTRKTVILLSGSDGTSEEVYFFMGRAALERGYNVLMLDGPGQVGAWRYRPDLSFRPDYEVPVSRAIDVALARPEVDGRRLALFGVSFGGYFVARTAACDRRVRAVISDSPLCDVGPVISAILGDIARMLGRDVALDEIDRLDATVLPPFARNPLKSHILRFGAKSAGEFAERANRFVLDAQLLRRVECPSLALGSTGEGEAFSTQTDFFARNVSGPVTRIEFDARQGADAHCQMGNAQMLNAAAFDWLDEVFA
jgi:pimeloyl-ACP methyl ester carboxylesterase